MKALFLPVVLATFALTACSSGVTNVKSVDPAHKISKVCLKGTDRAAPEELVPALQASLKKKNINSEWVKSRDGDCRYLLVFKARGNSTILARASLDLRDMENNKQQIGFVAYKRRGDEKDRVEQVGLQGQTDLMINELFK